eukprot:75473-Pelagomonas_calceolata.AAC.2
MPHLVWGILQPEDGAQACDGCNNSLHLANLWRLTRLLAGKQENVENVFSQSIREWTFPSSVIPNIVTRAARFPRGYDFYILLQVWEGTRGPTHIFALVHPAKHPQTISHTRMHARYTNNPSAATDAFQHSSFHMLICRMVRTLTTSYECMLHE